MITWRVQVQVQVEVEVEVEGGGAVHTLVDGEHGEAVLLDVLAVERALECELAGRAELERARRVGRSARDAGGRELGRQQRRAEHVLERRVRADVAVGRVHAAHARAHQRALTHLERVLPARPRQHERRRAVVRVCEHESRDTTYSACVCTRYVTQ